MAGMNQQINDRVETVFLMADVALQPIASRLVKEIALFGGDDRQIRDAATVARRGAGAGRVMLGARATDALRHSPWRKRRFALSGAFPYTGRSMRDLMRLIAGLIALLALARRPPALAPRSRTSRRRRARADRRRPPTRRICWLLDLSTGGRVTIWLRPDVAPKMVERVKTLTRQHFYDGLAVPPRDRRLHGAGRRPQGRRHRRLDAAQRAGRVQLSAARARRGLGGARRTNENSANSQFFIVFQPQLSLDKKYTVFGRVIDGMQYVDAIERGEPPANPSRSSTPISRRTIPPAYRAAPPPPPRARRRRRRCPARRRPVAAPKLAPRRRRRARRRPTAVE